MQDYSYIYLPGMVLNNPGITPRSHNLKQLINAPGLFTQTISLLKAEYNTYFHILSVSYCFCKICINNKFHNIAGSLVEVV